MNILMLDISGKVTKYTFWVANAIYDRLHCNDTIEVYTSVYKSQMPNYERFLSGMKYHRLLNLIPFKYKRSFSLSKRLLKSFETFLNYLYIMGVVFFKRIDILHTQYNPFADFISIEYYIYSMIKLLSPQTKLVLTIHDVLPHDLKPKKKEQYCKRYAKVAAVFDAYMVHTVSCKDDVINYLKLPKEKIHISYHPIFRSSYVNPKHNVIDINGRIKMIMFGLQTPYKGTDVLIDALNLLPQSYQDRFEVTIAGTINENYLKELKARSRGLNIIWLPYFLPEKELDERINETNVIILPYRSISQSGVLLLSLFFKKIIITSDLPSFVESLEGYDPGWFFESEKPQSLANLLMGMIDGRIDVNKQMAVIEKLNQKYSPECFAKSTLAVYETL